jgi:hypothetical protein
MFATVSAAETAPYAFLFSGSIFFFAMMLLSCGDILAKGKESRLRGGNGLVRTREADVVPSMRNDL